MGDGVSQAYLAVTTIEGERWYEAERLCSLQL
jgi:hypothetical protein